MLVRRSGKRGSRCIFCTNSLRSRPSGYDPGHVNGFHFGSGCRPGDRPPKDMQKQ